MNAILNPDSENESPFTLGLVAPFPPPAGGMANQARQLKRLWKQEGQAVETVAMNAPYRPALLGRIPILRAFFRLVPYLFKLWHLSGKADVIHVLANSGWSWHLFVTPAVWIAHLRGTPVIINYHGGAAESFFEKSWSKVAPTMKRASKIVVPSGFLKRVFERWEVNSEIIPNVIDVQRFTQGKPRSTDNYHLISTRNLESIYDVATSIRGFAKLLERFPNAHFSIAGRGPERKKLEALVEELNITGKVRFLGNLDNDQMVALYQSADAMVNTSRVDNMPIAILESFASGVPVVTSDAGGIPFMVENGKNALLVPQGDPEATSDALVRILETGELRENLTRAGLDQVEKYSWKTVSRQWRKIYQDTIWNTLVEDT